MVFQFMGQSPVRNQPLKNEVGHYSIDDMYRYVSKRIMNQLKSSPELLGMMDTLITDHFMGPVDYFSPDGKILGPTQKRKVIDFWNENKIQTSAFYGMAADYFSDGNGFGWIGTRKDNATIEMKGIIEQVDSSFTKLGLGNLAEEEISKPIKIGYISASTTEIMHDEYGPTGYKQDASGKQIVWPVDQIVHIPLMDIDGKIRAYSGFKGLVKEVSLMFMVKENLLAKLENGGSPDNIIAIKNAVGASKARFERLKLALESFSHLKKSHGNMPIDADVSVIPIGSSIKDMEYRELAMFVISEYALALGVPVSRIPFLMTGSGGNANKGELSGNTEDAYQKKINNRRGQWECAWNPVFKKRGFIYKFRRDNLQDDVRETQAATQRASFVAETQNVLFKSGKKLTDQAMLQLLSGTKKNICMEDVEKVEDQMMGFNQPSAINPQDQQRESILKSKVAAERTESKMRNANNNGVSS